MSMRKRRKSEDLKSNPIIPRNSVVSVKGTLLTGDGSIKAGLLRDASMSVKKNIVEKKSKK